MSDETEKIVNCMLYDMTNCGDYGFEIGNGGRSLDILFYDDQVKFYMNAPDEGVCNMRGYAPWHGDYNSVSEVISQIKKHLRWVMLESDNYE